MKKTLYTIYALIMIISLFGCIGYRYTSCPVNDKAFFYKKAGVKPTKAYMRWGNR